MYSIQCYKSVSLFSVVVVRQLIQVCTPTLWCLQRYGWVSITYHHPLQTKCGLGAANGLQRIQYGVAKSGATHKYSSITQFILIQLFVIFDGNQDDT